AGPGALLDIEGGRLGGDAREVERAGQLVARDDIPVVARPPPQEGQVVHEGLGKEPRLAERLDAGRSVPLRERLAIGADNLGDVGVRGYGPAEGLDHRD